MLSLGLGYLRCVLSGADGARVVLALATVARLILRWSVFYAVARQAITLSMEEAAAIRSEADLLAFLSNR